MRTRFISRIKYLLFLLCLSVSADIFHGITERQHIWLGSILVEKGYVGDDLVFTNHTGPTITSVSANPTSIDLDTRPTGTITLSFLLAPPAPTSVSIRNGNTDANVPITTQGTVGSPGTPGTPAERLVLTALTNSASTVFGTIIRGQSANMLVSGNSGLFLYDGTFYRFTVSGSAITFTALTESPSNAIPNTITGRTLIAVSYTHLTLPTKRIV